MTVVNRLAYRLLRRLSAWAFNLAHGLQWLSLKAYDKSDFSKHRAMYRERKHYIKNGLGYAYDYIVAKVKAMKTKAE